MGVEQIEVAYFLLGISEVEVNFLISAALSNLSPPTSIVGRATSSASTSMFREARRRREALLK